MCEPTTIMAGVAMVMGAVSAYSGAKAQKNQAKYQAAVARNNSIAAQQQAKYNEQLAQDALERGRTEEYRQRLKTKDLAGKQRSQLASAGVDVNVGTPLDLLGDTFEMGELDALTVRNNAEREANAYRNRATNYTNQSGLFEADAGMNDNTASQISPLFEAGGAVLDGATTMYGSYQKSGLGKTTTLSNGETIHWNSRR